MAFFSRIARGRRRAGPYCLVALGALSACGEDGPAVDPGADPTNNTATTPASGPTSTPERSDPDPAAVVARPLPTTPVQTTLILARRGDKLLASAWVSASTGQPTPDPDRATVLWRAGNEICTRREPVIEAAQRSEPVSFDAGGRLQVRGRSGAGLLLERQRVGAQVAYATDARWTTDTLPDDARLMLPDALVQRGSVGPDLRPQLELEWMSPATGRLPVAGATLRWAGSDDPDDRMRLAMFSWQPGDGEQPAHVVCELRDDGEFTMPQTVDTYLRRNTGGALFTAMRQRETVHETALGDRVRVVQTAQP